MADGNNEDDVILLASFNVHRSQGEAHSQHLPQTLRSHYLTKPWSELLYNFVSDLWGELLGLHDVFFADSPKYYYKLQAKVAQIYFVVFSPPNGTHIDYIMTD